MTSPFPAYHRQKKQTGSRHNIPAQNSVFAVFATKNRKKIHRRQTGVTPAHIDNAPQKEHPVFKEKSNCPDTCPDKCFRQPKIQKKRGLPFGESSRKKRIDLISQSDPLIAYSMPVFWHSWPKSKIATFFPSPPLSWHKKCRTESDLCFFCKERYCQACFPLWQTGKRACRKVFPFWKVRFRRVDLWLHKKSTLIGGCS